jgi:hypothetical protein
LLEYGLGVITVDDRLIEGDAAECRIDRLGRNALGGSFLLEVSEPGLEVAVLALGGKRWAERPYDRQCACDADRQQAHISSTRSWFSMHHWPPPTLHAYP